MGTVYGEDKSFDTKIPTYGDDKDFTTLSAIPRYLRTVHVHHPALLKITRLQPEPEEVILDNLTNLSDQHIESDAIFPLDCPATIAVTIVTGKSYTFNIS